jgi:hypothetical protein
VTPHGPHGHLQRPADFLRVQVFTVAKDENRAGLIRQRCNQPSEAFLKQRIRFRRSDSDFGQILHLNFLPKARTPQRIDAAMGRRSAQPCNAVGACFHGSPILEQFQKDLLGHFFRDCRVVEKVKGDAVHHTLMLMNSGFKVGVRHLPSKLITIEPIITTQNSFDVSSKANYETPIFPYRDPWDACGLRACAG